MTFFYKTVSRLFVVLLLVAGPLMALAINFPVINNNDSGPGSLREAIIQSNLNPGPDDITFALPVGQEIITPLTAFPVIVGELFINGYSQPGAVAGPIGTRTIVVEIDGANIGAGADLFAIASGNVTIAGLAVYNCPDYAFTLSTNIDNIHFWGNYIGTNASGTATGLGNQGGIISNFGSATPNINTQIIVGTDGDGLNDGNEGNLVVSSAGAGVNGFGIVFWLTQNSRISGNIIGLDRDGIVAGLGNAQDGILITVGASNNVVGTDGDGISDDLEGNIIAANGTFGILNAGNSNNNIIAGNKIGLDVNDDAAGNGTYGIGVLNSSGLRIGTNGDGISDDLEGNNVSSNGLGGIGLITYDFFGFNGSTSNNTIAGNIIGTDGTLSLDRGNTGSGIFMGAGFTGLNVSDNIIGSNFDTFGDDIEGNVITNNDTGISILNPVPGATTNGNKIARNSIFGNSQLGIDLGNDGVSVNDDGDADAGANDLLNAPVLLSTQIAAGDLTITGFTAPNSVVEFFISDGGISPNPLPGGFTKSFGEGQTFLFRAQEGASLDGINDDDATSSTYDGTVEGTGAGGTRTENRFSFTIPIASLPTPVTSGTRITALAYLNTSLAGSSSEFAGSISASALPVSLTSFKGRVDGDKAELTWTTAEEINNSHFEVERSANGQVYAKIGSVQGNGGINNTYHFTDNGPLGSVNYYRLKQVDIDGKATYTRTLVLQKELGVITAKAAPSPFISFINLSYKLQKEENIRIRLIDQVGRTVKTYSTRGGIGVNTINLNGLDHLPKGIYTVELTGETVSFRQQVSKM